MKQKNKKQTYQKGLWAEWYAALWLCIKGYSVLFRRYKTKAGEIDLIASRGKELVFIEVKAHGTYNKGASAILPSAKGRIFRTAQLFIASSPKWSGMDVRFDAIIVHNLFIITHITNAWSENDCYFKKNI